MKKNNYLLLVIYVLFTISVVGQNLKLNIQGETEKETQLIDSISYENNFQDISSLLQEKDSLKKRLYKTGYIETKELFSKKINDTIYSVKLLVGNKFNTIYIYYKDIPSKILNAVSNDVTDSYFIIPFTAIESSLNYINKELSNLGSPFQTVQLVTIEKQSNHILKAELKTSDTESRTISNIKINGYTKFPKAYLKRFLKIRKDDVFNLEEVKRKTEALNELRFANQIKDPEVLFTKDSTTLYIYVEKRSSNTFDGFLGFGTNEATNNIEFDGYLDLNLVNNLNFGESFKLLYKSDENDQQTFDVNLELPYIFNSPLGIEAQLNIFRKDSTFTTVNQSAKLFYQINPRSKISTGVNFIQSNNSLDEATFLTIDDYNSSFYSVGYHYIKSQANNTLFPINFFIDTEGGLGNRKDSNNEQTQSSIEFNTFKIFNLNAKNSIYLRLNGAFLFSDNYFFNELYRFGGINSIRGFEENSLFASGFSLINTEYRYQLSNTLYVNSVFDAAYYENELSNLKERLFGFGFGFGLLTKAGIFKLNYANGKSENQKFKFSDSKIHISLTANF